MHGRERATAAVVLGYDLRMGEEAGLSSGFYRPDGEWE